MALIIESDLIPVISLATGCKRVSHLYVLRFVPVHVMSCVMPYFEDRYNLSRISGAFCGRTHMERMCTLFCVNHPNNYIILHLITPGTTWNNKMSSCQKLLAQKKACLPFTY